MDNNLTLPDDLQEKLGKVLSSPESMAKISQMLGSLGGTPAAPPPVGETPEPPPAPTAAPVAGLPAGLDIAKLMPLLSGVSGENNDARLLRALKPYLHGERADRLDGAIRMMQLSQVLPLISGMGRDPKNG